MTQPALDHPGDGGSGTRDSGYIDINALVGQQLRRLDHFKKNRAGPQQGHISGCFRPLAPVQYARIATKFIATTNHIGGRAG